MREQVIESLRSDFKATRGDRRFIEKLTHGRIQQLRANMVDGRILPTKEIAEIAAAIASYLRDEVIPQLARRTPDRGIELLDALKEFGFDEVDGARSQLSDALLAKYPPPEPLVASEVDAVRRLCVENEWPIGSPVKDSNFVAKLKKQEKLELPADVIALYGAIDGFELFSVKAGGEYALGFLAAGSIDVVERAKRYPKRVEVFSGGNDIQLSIFNDKKSGKWKLVYDYEREPVAAVNFDLLSLLSFGCERSLADNEDDFDGKLSWETFFQTES